MTQGNPLCHYQDYHSSCAWKHSQHGHSTRAVQFVPIRRMSPYSDLSFRRRQARSLDQSASSALRSHRRDGHTPAEFCDLSASCRPSRFQDTTALFRRVCQNRFFCALQHNMYPCQDCSIPRDFVPR